MINLIKICKGYGVVAQYDEKVNNDDIQYLLYNYEYDHEERIGRFSNGVLTVEVGGEYGVEKEIVLLMLLYALEPETRNNFDYKLINAFIDNNTLDNIEDNDAIPHDMIISVYLRLKNIYQNTELLKPITHSFSTIAEWIYIACVEYYINSWGYKVKIDIKDIRFTYDKDDFAAYEPLYYTEYNENGEYIEIGHTSEEIREMAERDYEDYSALAEKFETLHEDIRNIIKNKMQMEGNIKYNYKFDFIKAVLEDIRK